MDQPAADVLFAPAPAVTAPGRAPVAPPPLAPPPLVAQARDDPVPGGGVRPRWVGAVGLGTLFVALALAMAFGDPTKLASHFVGDLGDATLLEWLMRWNAHALATDPGGIFSPNIYWPTSDTLVYTDTFIPPSLVAAPLRLLLGWPLGFNLFHVANWTLSLVCAFVLVRWFTRDTAASVLGALVFGFAAVRMAHHIHFNHSLGFLVPLTIWLLLRFLTERDQGRHWLGLGLALGLSSAVTFLSLGYMALALALSLPVVVVAWLVADRFRPGRRFWAGLGAAGLVVAILCGPVVAKVRDQGDHLTREFKPGFAAAPSDFLAPTLDSYLYGFLEDWADRGHENRLFPGLLASGLAVAGVLALARRRAVADPDRRRALWALLGGAAVVTVAAFGNYQTVAGRKIPLPYSLVSQLGAGFASVRAFGRFFTVALAVMAVFVGIGFARLTAERSRRFATIVAVAAGAVMVLEYAGEVKLNPRFDRPEHTAVNHALADLPPGPVLELPMGNSGDVSDGTWPYIEGPRMVLSSIDWNPRVNGYSGYASPDLFTSIHLFNPLAHTGQPNPEAVDRLVELGISYVVVRTGPMSPAYDLPGTSYYTPDQVANLMRALPEEMVAAVTTHGQALLVRLR